MVEVSPAPTIDRLRSELHSRLGRDPADRWEATVLLESWMGVRTADALRDGVQLAERCRESERSGPAPRVALITEGNYPYTFGGVSTWCDQLVRGLPTHRFTVHSVTARRGNRSRWHLPPNVCAVTELPFWEQRPPDRRLRFARAVVSGQRPPGAVAVDAVGVVQRLLTLLVSAELDERGVDEVFDHLLDCAASGELAAAFRSPQAFRWLCELWADSEPRPTMADVGTSLDLLEHFLRPVACELPDADVYHAVSNGFAGLVALAAARRRPGPVVLSEHGVYLRERYLEHLDGSLTLPVRTLVLRFHRLLNNVVYRRADVLVPVSQYNRRWELHSGVESERIEVIYNGVDIRRFPVGPPRRRDHAPVLGFIGRIDRIKDPLTLIRAAGLLVEELPRLRVRMWGEVMAGQDDYDEECRAEVARLGLADVVTFEGRTSNPVDAYHAADVVVICSISEGLPYGVIEAMATGSAVVATDVGGISEALGGTGVLVPPRSPELLAAACSHLISRPVHRAELGAAARRRAEELFGVERMIVAYRDLYASIVVGERVRWGAGKAGAP